MFFPASLFNWPKTNSLIGRISPTVSLDCISVSITLRPQVVNLAYYTDSLRYTETAGKPSRVRFFWKNKATFNLSRFMLEYTQTFVLFIMMAKRTTTRNRRRTTKKKEDQGLSIRPEFVGTILLLMAGITVLSLFAPNQSALTAGWLDSLRILVGWGQYIVWFPLFLLSLCLGRLWHYLYQVDND